MNMMVTEIAVPMVTGIPEKIIDISLVTSLLVFGLRVFAKELKALLNDYFQILEVTARWWIYIMSLFRNGGAGVVTAPIAE